MIQWYQYWKYCSLLVLAVLCGSGEAGGVKERLMKSTRESVGELVPHSSASQASPFAFVHKPPSCAAPPGRSLHDLQISLILHDSKPFWILREVMIVLVLFLFVGFSFRCPSVDDRRRWRPLRRVSGTGKVTFVHTYWCTQATEPLVVTQSPPFQYIYPCSSQHL